MYFNVKRPLKILGKIYIPCVCYSVPKVLEATVTKLVSDGVAEMYENKVAFVNGKKAETKKTTKKTSKKSKTVVKEEAE